MFEAQYGTSSDSNYQFPPDDINPKLKQEPSYCLKFAQAAYQMYVRDQGGIRYTKIRDIQLNRLYAEGRQPVEKYLDTLCGKKDPVTNKRKSYLDISTEILSVIPKFRSIVVGKFIQRDHDIVANAIDEKSAGEKRNARLKLWADSQIKEMLAPYLEALEIGVEPQQAQGMIPKTIEELEMMEAAGAFKLKWEAGMEKLINSTFYASDWNNIKVKAYEDLFDLSMMATRDYTDKATGQARVRYVDPGRLVVRHSDEKLYKKKMDFAGEIIDITPNQIRVEAGEDIPLEKLNEIIRLYTDSNHLDYAFNENINDLYDQWGDTNIKVMDITWKTIDTIKQEKKTDSRGHARHYNKPYDYQIKGKKKNREILVGKKQMVYKCKWIVGSDYVYDYGVEEDILRPNAKEVQLPFTIYRLSKKSMLESIIPLADNFQLAWLKFQNTLAKAAPSGIAVDTGALKNVTNGKNLLKPLEILKIRRETGDLLFSSTTHHSQQLSPSSARPIFDIPGGAGTELDEYVKVMDFNINMIRQITGINAMMDATAPAPDTLVGTAEIAAQGTNNTLHNIYNSYKVVKENTASNISLRIQNIIRYVDYKPYEAVVGMSVINIFRAGGPIAHAMYGIKLQLKPDKAEKQSLLDKAQYAFQTGMLTLSDYMYVEQEVINGSVKMARIFLMYREDKYKQEKMMENQANVQQQSEAIQQQQDNALKNDAMMQDIETGNEIKKMGARKEFDIEEYAAKGEMIKDQDDNKSQNKVKEDILKS